MAVKFNKIRKKPLGDMIIYPDGTIRCTWMSPKRWTNLALSRRIPSPRK